MFALLVAAVVGQATTPPLKNYSLKCPQGHVVNFMSSGNVFVNKTTPPAPQGGTAPAATKNYGVAQSRLTPLPPGKSWYGGNVDARPAVGATGKPPNRVHLTFIGSQVEREAARKDLEASPDYQRFAAKMGDLLAVQDYGPENPLVADVGLVDGGKPDVIIQTTEHPLPLYRAHEYPGADVLVAQLRRADPRYDPSQDPDGSEGGTIDLSRFLDFKVSSPTEWAAAIASTFLLVFLFKN